MRAHTHSSAYVSGELKVAATVESRCSCSRSPIHIYGVCACCATSLPAFAPCTRSLTHNDRNIILFLLCSARFRYDSCAVPRTVHFAQDTVVAYIRRAHKCARERQSRDAHRTTFIHGRTQSHSHTFVQHVARTPNQASKRLDPLCKIHTADGAFVCGSVCVCVRTWK